MAAAAGSCLLQRMAGTAAAAARSTCDLDTEASPAAGRRSADAKMLVVRPSVSCDASGAVYLRMEHQIKHAGALQDCRMRVACLMPPRDSPLRLARQRSGHAAASHDVPAARGPICCHWSCRLLALQDDEQLGQESCFRLLQPSADTSRRLQSETRLVSHASADSAEGTCSQK